MPASPPVDQPGQPLSLVPLPPALQRANTHLAALQFYADLALGMVLTAEGNVARPGQAAGCVG